MINLFDDDNTEEQLTGKVCPKCGYPTVIESDLEVCYYCGWFEGCEKENADI